MKPIPYPKPGPCGGTLIREVIGLLKREGVRLPINSHILIALSGGSDSLALAHLLVHYGRRVADRKKIRFLHINHGWRGDASKSDARFVQKCARKWKVPLDLEVLDPEGLRKNGGSWEEAAREARKTIFRKKARRYGGFVFTAHQADDLAETVLWRLLTGSADTHGGGILVQQEQELRPLLKMRRKFLMNYLKEEGQTWCEDSTNAEGRFLRSQMRIDLMPAVERIFPRAVEHLVELAFQAQNRKTFGARYEMPDALLGTAGFRTRRPHWELLRAKAQTSWQGEIHLPDRWKLRREIKKNPKSKAQSHFRERWVLEREYKELKYMGKTRPKRDSKN